jgi:hypothetical protein
MNEKIPTIYTIGDSHCWHGWLKVPGVITKTSGPMLMHSIGLSNAIIINDIPKDSLVIFCWGEIDCRCHVHKYQPWEETIDTLVKNYLNILRLNAKVNKNIAIFNVVPPPRRKNAHENASFPFLGSDDERLSYVKYMNNKLSESEFIFIDVYDKYCDSEGFMNMKLSDGHVHIAEEKYLVEWVNKYRSNI